VRPVALGTAGQRQGRHDEKCAHDTPRTGKTQTHVNTLLRNCRIWRESLGEWMLTELLRHCTRDCACGQDTIPTRQGPASRLASLARLHAPDLPN
jgi:hypothetical protein